MLLLSQLYCLHLPMDRVLAIGISTNKRFLFLLLDIPVFTPTPGRSWPHDFNLYFPNDTSSCIYSALEYTLLPFYWLLRFVFCFWGVCGGFKIGSHTVTLAGLQPHYIDPPGWLQTHRDLPASAFTWEKRCASPHPTICLLLMTQGASLGWLVETKSHVMQFVLKLPM